MYVGHEHEDTEYHKNSQKRGSHNYCSLKKIASSSRYASGHFQKGFGQKLDLNRFLSCSTLFGEEVSQSRRDSPNYDELKKLFGTQTMSRHEPGLLASKQSTLPFLINLLQLKVLVEDGEWADVARVAGEGPSTSNGFSVQPESGLRTWNRTHLT